MTRDNEQGHMNIKSVSHIIILMYILFLWYKKTVKTHLLIDMLFITYELIYKYHQLIVNDITKNFT